MRSLLPSTAAAWFIYLAADFLLHAVFLSGWWRATGDYWRPPNQLFQFIPLAYVAFAITCATLNWLLARLYGPRPSLRQGLRLGAVAGVLFGITTTLANYSVFSMPLSVLWVWPLTVIVESAGAGIAAAWVLNAQHPWRRCGAVLGITIGLLVVGIIVQNVFLQN